MTIYIIRPKAMSVARYLDLISKKFTVEKRQEQVQSVAWLQMEDPLQQEISDWIKDAQNRGVIEILNSRNAPKITGTTIAEMSDREAEQMRQDLPNVQILRDQLIDLIQPRRAVTQTKQEIATSDLWHLQAIGLEAARRKGFERSGKNVTIAVFDTGIDSTHPELHGKIVESYSFDVKHWEALPTSPQDTDGHGTHVAGLICGKNVGVAPEAKLISSLILPRGVGNLSNFIQALEWAATRPDVQIVNISASIRGCLNQMSDLVEDLLTVGLLPVCAVGNDGRNITCSPGNYKSVVSVGATNRNDRIASFSSSGTLVIDNHQYQVPYLVAPGEAVYSSVIGGGYEAWNGTSIATSIVSGIAALIIEKYPDITVPELREELFSSCKDLGELKERQGQGLVQVTAAL